MPRPKNKRVERERKIAPPKQKSFKAPHAYPHVILHSRKHRFYDELGPELEAYFKAGVPVEFHNRPYHSAERTFTDSTTGQEHAYPVYNTPRGIKQFLHDLNTQNQAAKLLVLKAKRPNSGGYSYYFDSPQLLQTFPKNGKILESRALIPHPKGPNPYYRRSLSGHDFSHPATGAPFQRPPNTVEPLVTLAQPRSQRSYGYNT